MAKKTKTPGKEWIVLVYTDGCIGAAHCTDFNAEDKRVKVHAEFDTLPEAEAEAEKLKAKGKPTEETKTTDAEV